jgi:hypothetical protein
LELGPGIAAISEDVAQPRVGASDRVEEPGRTVPVLNIGGMNDQSDQKADGVGQNVPFAAFDLLASIEPPNTTALPRNSIWMDHAALLISTM